MLDLVNNPSNGDETIKSSFRLSSTQGDDMQLTKKDFLNRYQDNVPFDFKKELIRGYC